MAGEQFARKSVQLPAKPVFGDDYSPQPCIMAPSSPRQIPAMCRKKGRSGWTEDGSQAILHRDDKGPRLALRHGNQDT